MRVMVGHEERGREGLREVQRDAMVCPVVRRWWNCIYMIFLYRYSTDQAPEVSSWWVFSCVPGLERACAQAWALSCK